MMKPWRLKLKFGAVSAAVVLSLSVTSPGLAQLTGYGDEALGPEHAPVPVAPSTRVEDKRKAEEAEKTRRLEAENKRLEAENKRQQTELEKLRQQKEEAERAVTALRRQGEAEQAKRVAAASKPAEAQSAAEACGQNSIGMEFVRIRAGSFEMGSNEDGDEKPVHQVKISRDFCLGKYEVRQGEWKQVMGSFLPSRTELQWGCNPLKPEFYGDNKPVVCVSYKEVESFIQRLNVKEGTSKYRLPTEAEWEYAARAGTKSKYSFGDDVGQLGKYAWFDKNSNNQTHPVGGKDPNPWGLYDMHGNVWEWVQDWYDRDYYKRSASTDPKGPDKQGDFRVVRGGCWAVSAGNLRSADRGSLTPEGRGSDVGFRLALAQGVP